MPDPTPTTPRLTADAKARLRKLLAATQGSYGAAADSYWAAVRRYQDAAGDAMLPLLDEIEALRAALRPFAAVLDAPGHDEFGDVASYANENSLQKLLCELDPDPGLTVGDCRKAREVLGNE